jgi:hypothetical protein
VNQFYRTGIFFEKLLQPFKSSNYFDSSSNAPLTNTPSSTHRSIFNTATHFHLQKKTPCHSASRSNCPNAPIFKPNPPHKNCLPFQPNTACLVTSRGPPQHFVPNSFCTWRRWRRRRQRVLGGCARPEAVALVAQLFVFSDPALRR